MARRAQFEARLGLVSTIVVAVYAILLSVSLLGVFVVFPATELFISTTRIAAVAAAAAAAAVLFGVVRAKASIRSFVAYLLVLLTIFAAAVELYFSRDASLYPHRAAALAAGQPYEIGFPQDVALARREADPGVLVSVPMQHLYANPMRIGQQSLIAIGGAPEAATVHCNELGVTSVYRSDEYGFNNPAGLWGQVPIDVLLIGDSFVQGACVPPEKTLAAIIRDAYPRTISLGRDGAGPLLQLAALREYAGHLRPANIVWVYTEENDLADLQAERRLPVLASYLRPDFSQQLFERQPILGPLISRHLEELLDQYRARRWIPLRSTRQAIYNHLRFLRPDAAASSPGVAALPPELSIFADVLQMARREAQELQARQLFVFLPSFGSFSGRPPPATAARARVLEEAERAGFATLDVEAIFRATGDPRTFFPFGLYGHYTPEGYALIGQAVSTQLAAFGGIQRSR